MITGGKIVHVEARRDKEGPVSGMNINIGIDDLVVKGDEITVQYTFLVEYQENIGNLKIVGVLYASEEREKAKAIEDMWKKTKKLPEDFAEVVLNTINYTCGVNGTFVVQPVRLSPPMQLPRVRVQMAPEEKKQKKPEKGAA
ncbi:MAG: hypothetical protein QXF56_02910 [Candidatus Micrarchaeia archaeon]